MKKEDEKVYSEKDIVNILSKLGLTTESDECDCDECNCGDEDDVEVGYPCTLNSIPKYDTDKFQSGVDSVTEMCGAITALQNVGIKTELAVEILMNLKMMNTEMDALKENGKVQVEVSKNQGIMVEKQQI